MPSQIIPLFFLFVGIIFHDQQKSKNCFSVQTHRILANARTISCRPKTAGIGARLSLAYGEMSFENLMRALKFLAQGQFRRVWNELHVRIYRTV
jgi:hypothetical protein